MPYSAQQYQNTPWNHGYYVQNSYVAPWATRFKQPQSPHQDVVTHGSEGYSSASQVLPVSSSYPPPPWTAGSLEPVPQSINSQQRAMLYGKCLISIRRIHLLRNNWLYWRELVSYGKNWIAVKMNWFSHVKLICQWAAKKINLPKWNNFQALMTMAILIGLLMR